MKNLQFIIVGVCFLAATTANAQYQKAIDKAEEKYEVGNYSGAAADIAKMLKKTTKKLGPKNPFNAIGLTIV